MYETFKVIKTREQFFDSWDTKEIIKFTEELKNRIYDKYVIKCKILQRDNFKCQNVNCKYPNSKLTIHHVKHRRNNGETKIRNLITVCHTCHDRFNRCKDGLTFSKAINVPPHLRGHTFILEKVETKIDWKKINSEMRQCRKQFKLEYGFKDLSIKDWELVYHLFRFLSKPYDVDDDL